MNLYRSCPRITFFCFRALPCFPFDQTIDEKKLFWLPEIGLIYIYPGTMLLNINLRKTLSLFASHISPSFYQDEAANIVCWVNRFAFSSHIDRHTSVLTHLSRQGQSPPYCSCASMWILNLAV